MEFVLQFARIFITPNPWNARYDLYCEAEYKEMAQVGPISNGWHDPREEPPVLCTELGSISDLIYTEKEKYRSVR